MGVWACIINPFSSAHCFRVRASIGRLFVWFRSGFAGEAMLVVHAGEGVL
jgi:hypothetical protein